MLCIAAFEPSYVRNSLVSTFCIRKTMEVVAIRGAIKLLYFVVAFDQNGLFLYRDIVIHKYSIHHWFIYRIETNTNLHAGNDQCTHAIVLVLPYATTIVSIRVWVICIVYTMFVSEMKVCISICIGFLHAISMDGVGIPTPFRLLSIQSSPCPSLCTV